MLAVRKSFYFIGSCVENPFGETMDLCAVVEHAAGIGENTFLEYCCIEDEVIGDMTKRSHLYRYYESSYDGRTVYFYALDGVEYFFMEDQLGG